MSDEVLYISDPREKNLGEVTLPYEFAEAVAELNNSAKRKIKENVNGENIPKQHEV